VQEPMTMMLLGDDRDGALTVGVYRSAGIGTV
jgi:hypothetical protein